MSPTRGPLFPSVLWNMRTSESGHVARALRWMNALLSWNVSGTTCKLCVRIPRTAIWVTSGFPFKQDYLPPPPPPPSSPSLTSLPPGAATWHFNQQVADFLHQTRSRTAPCWGAPDSFFSGVCPSSWAHLPSAPRQLLARIWRDPSPQYSSPCHPFLFWDVTTHASLTRPRVFFFYGRTNSNWFF